MDGYVHEIHHAMKVKHQTASSSKENDFVFFDRFVFEPIYSAVVDPTLLELLIVEKAKKDGGFFRPRQVAEGLYGEPFIFLGSRPRCLPAARVLCR